MAQIVKSLTGYWVGKEIQPNTSYISFDSVRFHHPVEKILEVGFDELTTDIQEKMGVLVSKKTPDKILRKIATELCSEDLGMIYLQESGSPFGVRKIIDPPNER